MTFTPARYRFPETFRFRHVKPGLVFEIKQQHATAEFEAGHYVRVGSRKALPCCYHEWSNTCHVNAADGVRYIPANLPVTQVQV